MRKKYVCRNCNGTGEMIEEQGGDGYNPIYCECSLCDGTGIEIYDSKLVYQEV